MGDYERALTFSNEGLALPYVQQYPAEYAGLLSNRLVALMATAQYAEAERCIAQLSTLLDRSSASNPQYYARLMTHVYRDDAELALHKRKFDVAHSKANLGLELAQSLGLRLELSDLYFTCAHLALAETPGDTATIEGYFAKAEEMVQTLESPIMVANCLLAEANLLKRQGHRDRASTYAQHAAVIFQEQGLTEALSRAEEIGAG
jgi:ATP/maltotriose-dependent transcriptional regulator MalT